MIKHGAGRNTEKFSSGHVCPDLSSRHGPSHPLGGIWAGAKPGNGAEGARSPTRAIRLNMHATRANAIIGCSNTVLARSWIVGRRTASLLCREVGSSARQASLCRRCRHQLILLRVLSSSFVQLVLRQIIPLCCQHMNPLSPVLPSLGGATRPQLALALALLASSSRRRKPFVLSDAASLRFSQVPAQRLLVLPGLFDMAFTGAAWSKYLGELIASGLLSATFDSLHTLEMAIDGLAITSMANLTV